MGYDICIAHGAKWFAIQPTMLSADKAYRALAKEPASVRDLCSVYGTRLKIARAIALMVSLVPVSGDINDILLKASLSPAARDLGYDKALAKLAAPDFAVAYSGSGQYGVPNYIFEHGDFNESATEPNGRFFKLAYLERAEHAANLWRIAQAIFFLIYWRERHSDLTYYGYWERKDPDKVVAALISQGVFASRDEAAAACPGGDLDEISCVPAVRELGARLQREGWREYFDANWAEFEETDAIWHGHSN